LNFFASIKKEDGFTIQEILVVLLVGSILIGLSLSLFLFTNRLFQTWSGTSDLKNETNRILYNMASDIQQSREIIEHTDTSFVLSKGAGRIVRYIYNGRNLLRNDVVLTPQKAEFIKIKVAEERPLDENFERMPLFHINVLIGSKLINYMTEIDTSPAASSRLLFTQSKIYK